MIKIVIMLLISIMLISCGNNNIVNNNRTDIDIKTIDISKAIKQPNL